ncbi:MAG TPA: hypothetical protein VGX76_07400, partial [Pirellulales bacterium]|nr:hypothetical protein [Pirellulales bacterium]
STQAPFYPFLLAGAYKAFGVGSPAAIFAVRCLQCLAGTALVLLVVWLAWSLLPERPSLGWVAGWGAAVYPTHVYMVTHMQVAIWAALLLTFLLAVVVSPRGRQSWLKAALAGVTSGAVLLVEPILAIALPIAALAFLLADLAAGAAQAPKNRAAGAVSRTKTFTAPLGRVAVMAGVAVLVIAPWLVRNYRVHGEMVFIKSTFGYAFWQANNPISWGTDKIPVPSAEATRLAHDGTLAGMHRAVNEARLQTTYIDEVALAPGGYREFQGLSEPARSRLLSARAWEFIRSEPGNYLKLCLRRLRYFLLFDETNPKAANLAYRASSTIWLCLSVIGALALRPQWRRLWPTLAIFGAVTAFHTLTIVSARFRIPIEPLSFVWAAAPLALLIDRLGPRRRVLVERSSPTSRAAGATHVLQGPHRRLKSGVATQVQGERSERRPQNRGPARP